ncbi:MAG: rod-binding protein [Alphaproteobacteria bacterium]
MATLSAPALNLAAPAIPTVGSNVSDVTKAKLREKAQEFEAYYVQQFISLTRPDLSDTETFGGGQGEAIFASLLDEQMGKSIAKRGGFGIADAVYAELLQQQEQLNANPANTRFTTYK